ncbi:MAG: PAS domain S-box protein [Magnetospirillum gryphiswaldense]|nr:PAS domain S-box protein [Magnetospirillum gryphiswaldense]
MEPPVASIRSIALRMALGYAVFGVLWILASDRLASSLFRDPATLAAAQSWKGLFFVFLSAALIFVMGTLFVHALARSERRYRALFDDSPEALLIYDMDSLTIVAANTSAGRLLGRDAGALSDRRLVEFMTQPTAQAMDRELPRLRDLAHHSVSWQLRHQDGRTLDVSVHGQAHPEHGRRLCQSLLIDITARLRAETELLRTLDELASTNERMRELGHALSHDLQEPLRQVASFVQLLERRYADSLDAEATQFIDYAVEGVERLKGLIADVENFTRQGVVQEQWVEVGGVVNAVLDDLSAAITAANARVVVAPMPKIRVDPKRLAVVFHILLNNAVKFRRAEIPCEIIVEARSDEHNWWFSVQDNGIGIPPEFHASVFSLFHRLHTRDRFPGNGTGLALARKLVESWSGRIWVETSPQGGATFTFTLPANNI